MKTAIQTQPANQGETALLKRSQPPAPLAGLPHPLQATPYLASYPIPGASAGWAATPAQIVQRAAWFGNQHALRVAGALGPVQREGAADERKKRDSAFTGQAKPEGAVQLEGDDETQAKALDAVQLEEEEPQAKPLAPVQLEEDETQAKPLAPVQQEEDETQAKPLAPVQLEEDETQAKPLAPVQLEEDETQAKSELPLQAKEERDKKDRAFSGQAKAEGGALQMESDEEPQAKTASPVQLDEEETQAKTLSPVQLDEETQKKSFEPVQRDEETQEKSFEPVQRDEETQEKSEAVQREDEEVQSKGESLQFGFFSRLMAAQGGGAAHQGRRRRRRNLSGGFWKRFQRKAVGPDSVQLDEDETQAKSELPLQAKEERDKQDSAFSGQAKAAGPGPLQFGFFGNIFDRLKNKAVAGGRAAMGAIGGFFGKGKKPEPHEVKAAGEEANAGDEVLKDASVKKGFDDLKMPQGKERTVEIIKRRTRHHEGKIDEKELTDAAVQGKQGSPFSPGAEVTNKIQSARGGGEPLPEGVRTDMEAKFGGEDFGNVRIHTGETAVGLNSELKSRAFTNREDIHFNRGQFDPNTASGKHLLAHELTHVVQQRNIPDLQRRLTAGGERNFYEQEADSMADKVVGSGPLAAPAGPVAITPVQTPAAKAPAGGAQLKQGKSATPITGEAMQFGFFSRLRKKVTSAVKSIGSGIVKGLKAIGGALLEAIKAGVKLVGKGIEFLKNLAFKLLFLILRTLGEPGRRIIQLINMASSALKSILAHPIDFLTNLGKGLFQGFKNFVNNIGTHLKEGIKAWLQDKLGDKIEFPKTFDLAGIFSIIMQVLGLTYQKVRGIVASKLGEDNVSAIEMLVKGDFKGAIINLARSKEIVEKKSPAFAGGEAKSQEAIDTEASAAVTDDAVALVMEKAGPVVKLFKDVKTRGPIAIWDFVKSQLSELKTMLIKTLLEVVIKKVVMKAIEILATSSNPAGAIVRLAITVWNILQFFFRNFKRMLPLIEGIVSTFSDMAKNAPARAAEKVEKTLADAIPLAIDFLLSVIGLADIVKDIVGGIKKLRDAVAKPIEKVAEWVAKIVKPVFDAVRNAVVRAKAFVGKGISAAKAKGKELVEQGKAKAQELLEAGKQKAIQIYESIKKRFTSFTAALDNSHKSEEGAALTEQDKTKQKSAIGELESAFAGFKARAENNLKFEEMASKMEELKKKYQFGTLKGSFDDNGKFVVSFGFSPEKEVELPWYQSGILWLVEKAGEPGKQVAEIIKNSGAAVSIILESRASVEKFITTLGVSVGNAVKAFIKDFPAYLQKGFLDWVSGGNLGVNIPKDFSPKSIFGFILEIAGLGIERIKDFLSGPGLFQKNEVNAVHHFAKQEWVEGAVALVGEGDAFGPAKAMSGEAQRSQISPAAIDRIKKGASTFLEFFEAAKSGPGGLWDKIKDTWTDIKDDVIAGARDALISTAVVEIAKKAATLASGPVGGIIEFVKAIWNIGGFLLQNAGRAAGIAQGISRGLLNMAKGDFNGATAKVLETFQRFIPVMIDFVIRVSGLGDVIQKIKDAIKKIQEKVKEKIITLGKAIAKKVSPLLEDVRGFLKQQKDKLFSSSPGKAPPGSGADEPPAVKAALLDLDKKSGAKAKSGKITFEEAQQVANEVKTAHSPALKSLTVVDGGEDWDYEVQWNPTKRLDGPTKAVGTRSPDGVFTSESQLTEEILSTKPRNSPTPAKWFTKFAKATIKIQGNIWTYSDGLGNTVEYTKGYPNFKAAGLVRQEIDIKKFLGYHLDFKKADENAPKGPKQDTSTWHHNEDKVTMQEVDKDVHARFTHRGGLSLAKNGGEM